MALQDQHQRTGRTRSRRGFRVLAACALAWIAAACATYPMRTEAAFGDFRRGQFARALKQYSDPKTTGAPFLQFAEAGMVALTAGDWPAAVDALRKATATVDATERKALISPESAGETLLAWTINESFTEYQGEGYERVLLHDALALAYLAQGKVEDAEVELRQADALLTSEEKLYEKEYRAGGLGHFLSAVGYELRGKPDDAYIDYKRMERKGVGAELYGPALVRLADALGNESDAALWRERYGAPASMAEGQASVVVVAGIGLGSYKVDHTLTIPTPSGLLQWSVPGFKERPQPVSNVTFAIAGGDKRASTVVIEDVGRVARENLEDRIAWLAAKSTVRTFLKRELSRKLEEKNGLIGALAGAVFTIVTERADLRAWQTLPDTWQAARVFLPAGAHAMTISSGTQAQELGTIALEPGETMFVFARTLDSQLYAYAIGGKHQEGQTP